MLIQQKNGHGPIVAVKEIIPGDREENDRMIAHWNDEAMALRAMNKLSNDHIVHFITAFRRIKNDEVNLYLMFEWADGGNLRRLWESFNPEPRSPALVQAVVTQITGLAGALSAAHYPPSPQDLRYRHGDLKPENIFWFRNGGEIGKLKIGDWGEAKGHNIGTEFRADETAARFGTRRYEAPEVVTGLEAGFAGQTSNRRSRLYDVWAMGCITLEFLVWLIYGPSGLNTFNHSITGDPDTFYQLEKRGEKRTARVHDIVVQWMDDMAQEPLCASNTTALGNLLTIVRHDLLVVEIKYGALTSSILAQSAASVHHGRSDTNPERGEGRVRSDYFYRKMKGLNTYRDDVNRFPCPFRDVPMALCNLAEEARKEFPPRPKYQSTGEMVLVNGEIDYAQANVVVWNHRSDNISARYVLWAAQAKAGYNTTNVLSTARLCEGCQEIRDDIWRLGFSQVYVQDELRAGAEAGNCDLHRLFWDTCVKNGGLKFDTIRFHNHNSTLRMNSGAVPVLSIVRDQGKTDSQGFGVSTLVVNQLTHEQIHN